MDDLTGKTVDYGGTLYMLCNDCPEKIWEAVHCAEFRGVNALVLVTPKFGRQAGVRRIHNKYPNGHTSLNDFVDEITTEAKEIVGDNQKVMVVGFIVRHKRRTKVS